ncbi:disease resistance protein RUN1 [Eucalyptus grandis]|uniref:disease resistance protein RUN1 n=1 Tax=Eucalyptus grandis TaxID=71139 RepID=UPI00192EEE91|nr:disease resistance protein RUN1 [Eucalyptus grandis]
MAMATAEILALVNLLFAFASNPSMAFRIFLVMINLAIVAGTMRRNREPSSTSTSSSGINYEVFLSFRGADTRKTFTDHLHEKLVDLGIKVFRDDKDLCAGEEIKKELKDSIKRSRISIAILSKDYASSKSCLMELEQMWECRKLNGQTIIPIFYDVSPFDVKHQAGDFERSFHQHENDGVNSNTIEAWKEVLRRTGNLRGFDRENVDGGHEAQLVKEVVRRVRRVLKKDDQVVTDKLVGIDLHVQELMKKLGVIYRDGQAIQVRGDDVRVVGICGMPGVGKTTLAKVIFNKLHKLFEECSFLEGISSQKVEVSQEMLIADLQKEKPEHLKSSGEGIRKIKSLFSNMKVLIVLDDVYENKQIKALVEKLSWFGTGSRIIVTTSNRKVLKGIDFRAPKDGAANGTVEEYEVAPMRHDHALQLFRKHAFQGDAPQDVSEYDFLSIDITNAIGGLPLAVEITASSLYGEDVQRWRSTLKSLKKYQKDDIYAAFKACYESLSPRIKEIFLDIACFFIGKDKRIPSYMWDACNYDSGGIELLRDMHMLEDGENNELRMQNLLRDFGRKIVESKGLHERCRFWNHSDALSILSDGEGTERVQGIGLTFEEGCSICFPCEKFRKMTNLRYLRLDGANIRGNTENLLPNLRWLDWRESCSIPLNNMHLKKLVVLDLSRSVTNDSKIWSQSMEKVQELKVLNLQGCTLFSELLKFPAPINLEILILEDCTLFSTFGTFISKLECLSSLNLRNCKGVGHLPDELCRMKSLRELLIDGTDVKSIRIRKGSMENLEILSACDCKELCDISIIGHLRCLSRLALDGANIDWDPETFEFPQKLQRLSLRTCRKPYKLPHSIGKLKLLEEMDLSHTRITEMPRSVKDLRNLKTLKMAYSDLRKFSEDIKFGGKVPHEISGLSSLRILRLSSTEVAGLPESICCLSRLQTLDLLDCSQLQALPRLPSSLLHLLWGSEKVSVPDLSYLTNLEEIVLKDVEQPKAGWLMRLVSLKTPNIGWITRLSSLETLELSVSKVTNLPGNFSDLTQLRKLSLSYMKELDLTQLPSSSILTLCLKHCNIQEPKFSSLNYLSELELDDCNLAKIDGLEDIEFLEVLKIYRCRNIKTSMGSKK